MPHSSKVACSSRYTTMTTAKIKSISEDVVAQYQKAKKWRDRDSLVYAAIWFARQSEKSVELGLAALSDRARHVRYHACLLLAYSQRKDLLPALKAHLDVIPSESLAYLVAAIDAIESQNHNFFVDREHSGMVTLNLVE